MSHLSQSDLIMLFGSISLIVILARLVGLVCQKIRFPSVVGELATGIILGPTFLGSYLPALSNLILPKTSGIMCAFDAIFNISMIMLLFAAGLEINVSQIVKNRKSTFYIAILGLGLPFCAGFMWVVSGYAGIALAEPKLLHIASFIGIALTISALPVLARVLSELNIMNTSLGVIIMSVAFITDLVAWLGFSVVMTSYTHASLSSCIVGFIFVTLFTLFIFCKGMDIFYGHLFNRIKKPSDALSAFLGISLVCAFFTEYMGFHASLGAFLAGVSLNKITECTNVHKTLENFVNSFFAPIFFVSIGLKLNFITSFNLGLVLSVLGIALITKTMGAGLGAYLAGMKVKPALLVGCGLNARGSVEIVLCSIALNYGLINKDIFVAFVIMALMTSLIAGPIMLWLLNSKSPITEDSIFFRIAAKQTG